ncbi:MAG: hypothetical protein ACK5Y2_02565 [Bdellovibrionales bacterium]
MVDWKSTFSEAVQKNQTAQIQKLLNFSALESQALPSCLECETKKTLKLARQAFASGNLKQAETLYSKISKASEVWLESVEEKGWSYFRQDEFEKTLAQTKTLLSPPFDVIVNSEAYFLQSLTQLKICDYEGVLKTHRKFKDAQRGRIQEMQSLGQTGRNQALETVLKKTQEFPLALTDFGDELGKLPLQFYRDQPFQKWLLSYKVSDSALEVLPAEHSLRPALKKRLEQARAQLQERLKLLAVRENQENSHIVKKLNLIEVETLQRIHTDTQLADQMYRSRDFKKVNEDQLIFMDDGYPWIDEVDKYEVSAKSCAPGIRRKM